MKACLALSAAMMSLMLAAPAQADIHHGHGWHGHGARFGVFIGAPLYWPYYYPAYPVVREYVYESREPRYYEPGPAPEQNWYYCRDSKAYYPYVQECASEWEAVPAKPAPR